MLRPMRPYPLMATLTVIDLPPRDQNSRSGFCRDRFIAAPLGQCGKIAPAVAHLDEIHAVPLERLLDDEFAAKAFIECARGLVAGDDPGQESGRAVRALSVDDRADESTPEADALELAAQIDRDQFRVDV